MATTKQVLGRFGETIVAKECACPKCKRSRTLKRLPNNFKCADLICDFCGYLAQVKAATVRNHEVMPATILGAAWGRSSFSNQCFGGSLHQFHQPPKFCIDAIVFPSINKTADNLKVTS